MNSISTRSGVMVDGVSLGIGEVVRNRIPRDKNDKTNLREEYIQQNFTKADMVVLTSMSAPFGKKIEKENNITEVPFGKQFMAYGIYGDKIVRATASETELYRFRKKIHEGKVIMATQKPYILSGDW